MAAVVYSSVYALVSRNVCSAADPKPWANKWLCTPLVLTLCHGDPCSQASEDMQREPLTLCQTNGDRGLGSQSPSHQAEQQPLPIVQSRGQTFSVRFYRYIPFFTNSQDFAFNIPRDAPLPKGNPSHACVWFLIACLVISNVNIVKKPILCDCQYHFNPRISKCVSNTCPLASLKGNPLTAALPANEGGINTQSFIKVTQETSGKVRIRMSWFKYVR